MPGRREYRIEDVSGSLLDYLLLSPVLLLPHDHCHLISPHIPPTLSSPRIAAVERDLPGELATSTSLGEE